MVATALLFTLALILGVAFFLMGELKFLVAYKTLLLTQYGGLIAAYFGLLIASLVSGSSALGTAALVLGAVIGVTIFVARRGRAGRGQNDQGL